MIGLIQRVSSASVAVDSRIISTIDEGILLLVGVQKADTEDIARRLVERVVRYRIFEDEKGRMNRSLLNTQGELLIVPQFTLAADTQKGLRPSFTAAASPEKGQQLYDYFIQEASQLLETVKTGRFGADMQVSLVNEGPATFTLTVN